MSDEADLVAVSDAVRAAREVRDLERERCLAILQESDRLVEGETFMEEECSGTVAGEFCFRCAALGAMRLGISAADFALVAAEERRKVREEWAHGDVAAVTEE